MGRCERILRPLVQRGIGLKLFGFFARLIVRARFRQSLFGCVQCWLQSTVASAYLLLHFHRVSCGPLGVVPLRGSKMFTAAPINIVRSSQAVPKVRRVPDFAAAAVLVCRRGLTRYCCRMPQTCPPMAATSIGRTIRSCQALPWPTAGEQKRVCGSAEESSEPASGDQWRSYSSDK